MKTYELCIVSKEYRWVYVEAESESEAIDKAWDKVACGYTGDVKAEDYDTEVFLEGEVNDD
jgi:hypothetical protein